MLQRIRMTDAAIRDLHNGNSDVMLRIADAALETKMQKRKIKELLSLQIYGHMIVNYQTLKNYLKNVCMKIKLK